MHPRSLVTLLLSFMVLANSFAQDTLEWKSVIKREFISYDQFNRATGDRFHTILKEREFEEYYYLLEDGGALCFGSSNRVTCFLLPETQPEQELIEEITQLDLDEDAHSESPLTLVPCLRVDPIKLRLFPSGNLTTGAKALVLLGNE